jgi:glutamine synthetase
MDRRSVSAEQVLRAIRKCGVEYIRLETLDIAGIVRCRVVRPDLLEKVFDEGLNMSKAIFSFTVLEHMVPKPPLDS